MTIPSRDFRLIGGLAARAGGSTPRILHAHVVKHPMGIQAHRESGKLGAEGWDLLAPPVVTEEERRQFFADLPAFGDASLRCGLPEASGASSRGFDTIACYDCPNQLLQRCGARLASISGRYGSVIDDMIESIADERGVLVERARLSKQLFRFWRNPEALDGLVVASLGLGGKGTNRQRVLRIHRDDGTRVEFYAHQTQALSWRTCYRVVPTSPSHRIGLLLDVPLRDEKRPMMSEEFIVSRLWWENHGN